MTPKNIFIKTISRPPFPVETHNVLLLFVSPFSFPSIAKVLTHKTPLCVLSASNISITDNTLPHSRGNYRHEFV